MSDTFRWIRCKSCKRDTKHEQVSDFTEGSSDPEEPPWHQSYAILRCRGCGSCSYCTTSWFDGDCDPETGNPVFTVSVYPHRSAEREPFEYSHMLPRSIRRIYKEVIDAMNCSLPILSAIGLRTLIEAVCVHEKAEGYNLEQRIDGLAKQGVLAPDQAAILHSHRFLGNVAAHEIQAPESHELRTALQIAETILQTIYVLPRLRTRIKTGQNGYQAEPLPSFRHHQL